jgi:hypothetical protein
MQPSPFFKTNHPQGAKAVYFKPPTQGHHVIRFDEFYGDSEHMFNDVLFESDGGTSPSPGNGLVRDSDIQGNLIADCVDDGIEIERGTRNIRIWGNVFDRVGIKTICACPWWGPYYIFRNVVVRPPAVPASTAAYRFTTSTITSAAMHQIVGRSSMAHPSPWSGLACGAPVAM